MTALNAETGAVEWVRYTIPGPGEDGHDTWSGDVQGLRGVDRRAQHRRGGDARHITVARRHAILHGHGRCTKCDRRGRYRAASGKGTRPQAGMVHAVTARRTGGGLFNECLPENIAEKIVRSGRKTTLGR